MISWLDIVSPALRDCHDGWVRLRGTRLIPRVDDYPDFAETLPSETSACIAVPAVSRSPAYVYVGPKVGEVLGSVRRGMPITEFKSPVQRLAVSVPVYRVIRSRQPDSGRGEAALGKGSRTYEALLLPFGTDNSVRLIHAIYELARPAFVQTSRAA